MAHQTPRIRTNPKSMSVGQKKQSNKTKQGAKQPQLATRSQIDRLFQLVAEIQTGSYPNCPALQKLLERNRRTIMRDLQFLKESLRAPLEYDAARRGYHFTDDFTLMPPLDLKSEDFLMLHFLRQSLAPYEDTEIGGQMKKSFERMFGLLTGTKTWKKCDAAVGFRGEPKIVAPDEQLKTFEVLFSAIDANRVIQFEYHGRRKEPSERQVEPALVVMNKGRWYLYAVDRDMRELRTFALGRIKKIKMTRSEFCPLRPPLTPQDLFRHSFGIGVEEKEPTEVVIEFTPQAADLIRESIWHPNQKLEPLADGGVRFSLLLTSFYEIKPWILSWGYYARVVQPPELVEEIRAALAAASEGYAKQG